MNTYKNIFDILAGEKIYTISDIVRTQKKYNQNKNIFSSHNLPWIKDVFNEIAKDYENILDNHKNLPNLRLVAERRLDPFTQFSWKPEDKIFNLLSNYSIVIPNRILYLSYQFKFDDKDFYIPLDFFCLLFPLKQLLLNNISSLLPSRIKEDIDYSFEIIGTYNYRTSDKVILIPGSGMGYKEFIAEVKSGNANHKDDQFFSIPFLYNARTEDYLEIIDKYKDEYELYNFMMQKILDNKSDSEDLLKELIRDVSYSLKELDIIYKNKKKELMSKGLEVTVGGAFTLASLLLPPSFDVLKPFLASLFSSKTAFDGLKWIYDFNSAKYLMSDKDYWVLWKLYGKK